MTITAEQIAEIAGTVWSSFLGMTLRDLDTSESSAADDWHSASATVHISGSWNGSVILSCSITHARRAAAAMFEIGEDDLDDGEVADAFGELANIIGGNLKCLLPEPSQLSLPTVSLGAAHVVTVPGARLLEHVELECNGDRLYIAVWNRRDDRRQDHHLELERTVR
jgi:chemotaxis protein CheX